MMTLGFPISLMMALGVLCIGFAIGYLFTGKYGLSIICAIIGIVIVASENNWI